MVHRWTPFNQVRRRRGTGGITYVVVASWERSAVGSSSRHVDDGHLLLMTMMLAVLMMDDERGVEHRDDGDGEMRALTVDDDVAEKHGQRQQPTTSFQTTHAVHASWREPKCKAVVSRAIIACNYF